LTTAFDDSAEDHSRSRGEALSPSRARGTDLARWSTSLAVVVGVVCTAYGWWRGSSLWLDEILLALNIRGRSFVGLLEPLDYRQLAPIGFLWFEKAAIGIFGDGERTLRALSTAAAVAALVALPRLLRRFAGPLGVAGAVWLAVGLGALYRTTIQVKAAGLDLAASVILPLAFLAGVEGGRREKRLAGAAAACLAAFSFASWIVCGALILAFSLRRTTRRSLLRDADWRAPLTLAGASITMLFLFSRSRLPDSTREYMRFFWHLDGGTDSAGVAGRLAGLGGWFSSNLDWWVGAELGAFATGALALAIGLAWWRAARLRRAPVAVPATLAVSAGLLSVAGFYPSQGRLSLFLLPCWLTAVAAAIDALDRASSGPRLRVGLVLVVTVAGLAGTFGLRPGEPMEHPRELLSDLAHVVEPGDRIYVRYSAVPAWRYYAPSVGLDGLGPDVLFGECARDRPSAYVQEFDRLRGSPRVWVVFSHATAPRGHEAGVRDFLDGAGRRLRRITKGDASPGEIPDLAILYDLSRLVRFDRQRRRGLSRRLRAVAPLSCWQFDSAAAARAREYLP